MAELSNYLYSRMTGAEAENKALNALNERMANAEEHNAQQDVTIDDMILLMADMIGG